MFRIVSLCGVHTSQLRDRLPQRKLEREASPTEALLSKNLERGPWRGTGTAAGAGGWNGGFARNWAGRRVGDSQILWFSSKFCLQTWDGVAVSESQAGKDLMISLQVSLESVSR